MASKGLFVKSPVFSSVLCQGEVSGKPIPVLHKCQVLEKKGSSGWVGVDRGREKQREERGEERGESREERGERGDGRGEGREKTWDQKDSEVAQKFHFTVRI